MSPASAPGAGHDLHLPLSRLLVCIHHITRILQPIRFIHTHIASPLVDMLYQYILHRRRLSLLRKELDSVIRRANATDVTGDPDFSVELGAWFYLEGVRVCRAMEDARHEYWHFDGMYQCPECLRKAWWASWMATDMRPSRIPDTDPFIVKTLAELEAPGLRDLSRTTFVPPPFKWTRHSRSAGTVSLSTPPRLSLINDSMPDLDEQDAHTAAERLVDSPPSTPSSTSSTLVPETPYSHSSLDTLDSNSTLVESDSSVLLTPRKSSILLNPHGKLDHASPSPLSRKNRALDRIVFDKGCVKPDWTPSYLAPGHRRRALPA